MPAPADFTPEPWHGLYFRAFDALRFDRFYGAMGGETPITYLARTRYADDLGLDGDDRDTFNLFLSAIDDEYLVWRAETNKTA